MYKETICFFNPTKTWGGGEKWHYEMSTYLNGKGFKVLVIVTPNSELSKKLTEKGIPQEKIEISNLSFLNFKKVNTVVSFYKKHNVNIVVMNSSQDMKLGGLAGKKAKLKRIIYRRGSAIPIKNSIINRYFFKNVITEVLANSEATKETINRFNKNLFSKDKITVIPNGIDVSSFDKLPHKSLFEPSSKDEFVLGNLGRMVFQKNQGFLLDVALELKKRGVNFKLLIGGKGRLEEEIKEKIKKLNLENEVILLGFIKNPKDFMMSIDVFLLSSRWEGFGYVLAEAMLCKKPVIAFDISSNSQLIEPELNGFLTPLNNVKEFCDKIEFYKESPLKMSEMGVYGRNKIEKYFNSTLIQEKVKNYLLN